MNSKIQCVAFDGARRIASGDLSKVALAVMKAGAVNALIFDEITSEPIELETTTPGLDARSIPRRSLRNEAIPKEPPAPGRPKLGVVAREVTLLPRHWDWLSLQPGGASVALRKLVDEARRVHYDSDRLRMSKEAAYRFVSALAGDEQGFEEAIRGLFAGDPIRFAQHSQTWPEDVREHAANLAARVFEGNPL